MDLAKYEMRVLDEQPFKERFQWSPPLMVNEVCAHVKVMLEVGAIHPSQSLWCIIVVLVCKKDGGLCFCIDFCQLNARTKKDSYPFFRIQEAIGSQVGAGCVCCLDLKVGFGNCHGWSTKAIHCFHHGKPRIFWVCTHAIQAVQCPCHFSKVNTELPRGTEPNILLNLYEWCDTFLKDWGGALAMLECYVQLLLGTQVWILPGWDLLLGPSYL